MYIKCVAECAEVSMVNAVESVKVLPHYEQEGEVEYIIILTKYIIYIVGHHRCSPQFYG